VHTHTYIYIIHVYKIMVLTMSDTILLFKYDSKNTGSVFHWKVVPCTRVNGEWGGMTVSLLNTAAVSRQEGATGPWWWGEEPGIRSSLEYKGKHQFHIHISYNLVVKRILLMCTYPLISAHNYTVDNTCFYSCQIH